MNACIGGGGGGGGEECSHPIWVVGIGGGEDVHTPDFDGRVSAEASRWRALRMFMPDFDGRVSAEASRWRALRMFMHPILMVEYRLAASRCRRWRAAGG